MKYVPPDIDDIVYLLVPMMIGIPVFFCCIFIGIKYKAANSVGVMAMFITMSVVSYFAFKRKRFYSRGLLLEGRKAQMMAVFFFLMSLISTFALLGHFR